MLLDKPAGWTSHDVVAKLRKILGERQIGHAGTLDPDATGLLVIGVGNGTRLMRFLGDMDKTYVCEIVFGSTTDTLDDSGVVTGTFDMGPVDAERARTVIADRFVGDIMQVPPMVSALKVDGKRLHQLAREGIEVERQPRPITVHSFSVEPTVDPNVLSARIHCGSGTYVRSLGADLGEALGGGAHIRALRRLTTGPFDISDASTIESPVLLPVERIVAHLNAHTLDAKGIDDTLYGRVRDAFEDADPWAVFDESGSLVAVFERFRDTLAKPTVVFGGR
ncbi:MAG: tRNA pseudouridine synthase [Actinomycetota bacterium]